MVWNNSITLFAYITFVTTSSIDFGVLVCVLGFLDPFVNDPNSYTILFPSSNSNGSPIDSNLLGGTCNFVGLNTSKVGCVATFFVYSSIACRPSCVYYCCYCKCCGLAVVFIQSSYTFPSKCRCSSPSRNLMSCSSLTSWLYSLGCFSCGDVICGTSYFCSLDYLSCGDVIFDTFVVCLALFVPLLALKMVPLCLSSFSMLIHMCFLFPFHS
jgi:hypothetical protein